MALVGSIVVIINVLVAAWCAHQNIWPLPLVNLTCAVITLRSMCK